MARVESQTRPRKCMDLHGYIIHATTPEAKVKEGKKLAQVGLTPKHIEIIQEPDLLKSEPWRYMWPIYPEDQMDPLEPWRAVLGPMEMFGKAKNKILASFKEADPFVNPRSPLPANPSDDQIVEENIRLYKEYFGEFDMPLLNQLAIMTMAHRGELLHLLTSFATYRIPVLEYAFDDYHLNTFLANRPITGWTRRSEDIPITFYKVFAFRVMKELIHAYSREECEVGEDDRLIGAHQVAENGTRVNLCSIDPEIDKRDLEHSPLKREMPQRKWDRGRIRLDYGLPQQAGIDEETIEQYRGHYSRPFRTSLGV
jgi:hypothetical protein